MKKNLPSAEQKKPINKSKKVVITAIVCLCVVAIVIGVIAAINISRDMKNKKAIGTCGAYDIPYEELRYVTSFYKNELALKYGADIWDSADKAKQYAAELEELVVTNLNENYAILTICDSYGIATDSKEISEYVDTTISNMIEMDFGGKKDDYKKFLEDAKITERQFKFSIKTEYLRSAVFKMVVDKKINIDYTTENINEFIEFTQNTDAYARTIHVYIRNDKGDKKDQNLKIANMISERVREITDPEDRLAKMHEYIGRYSEDFKMTTTDGAYFAKNEMDEIYESHAFELDVNGVSQAFECTDGYYVIMRLAPDVDYVTENAIALLQNYQSAQMGLLIQRYRDNYPAVLNEYGKSINLWEME
jgi:hypothetical protein